MFCSSLRRWTQNTQTVSRQKNWTAITYNCQALPSHRPLSFVLQKLPGDIIALQGTGSQWGWPVRRGRQSSYVKNIAEFSVYVWPCNLQSAMISRQCGVILAIKREFLPKKAVIRVVAPPEELEGRIGGLRVRLRSGPDFNIYNLYFPPPSYPNSAAISSRMTKWLEEELHKLPSRTNPFLITDANARLGTTCLR